MVLESALPYVEPGQEAAVKAAFGKARHVICVMLPSVTTLPEYA
ncbi:hypothetical protein [Ralstonia soli]|nr:hypothetical protein [Ralstonia soli]